MLIYDCPSPVVPKKRVDGSLVVATMQDYETVKALMRGIYDVTSEKVISNKECEDISRWHIESGNLFLWKNSNGKTVAMCGMDIGKELGKVILVYTIPEERRKGYAARIVYEVSCKIKDQGLLPILYTDGDYSASNECYKGIGYIERGCLCNITRK
jgi:predicted GNAT family acetyltransferase